MLGTSETTSALPTVGALLTPPPCCKTWPRASTQDAELGQAPPIPVKTFLVKNHLSVHNLAPAATLSPFFSGFPPPVNLFTPRSVLGPVRRPQYGGEPPARVLRAEHEDGDVEGVLRENSLPRLCLLCPPLPPSWLPRRLLFLQTLQPRQRRQDELWPCISRGSGGNIFHLLSHRHQN